MFMPLFFRFQRPIEGTIDILALTGTTAYLTYIYSGIDEVAAWTMVPYLGWLTFASYLSVGIGYLNNWNFTDKQAHYPPRSKPAPTKYVNEAPPDKKAL
jgi:benzodiazapine receptor